MATRSALVASLSPMTDHNMKRIGKPALLPSDAVRKREGISNDNPIIRTQVASDKPVKRGFWNPPDFLNPQERE